MAKDDKMAPPNEMEDLAKRCVLHVESRFKVRPDHTAETLPLIDHLIDAVVAEESRGGFPPPGHPLRAQLVPVLAPAAGAYFGEVVRRCFACRWRATTEDPLGWLLEFDDCPLRLRPFAAVAEAILRDTTAGGPAVLRSAPRLADGLLERLAAAPGLPDDQFYTLSSRFEVLQIAVEWLLTKGKFAAPLVATDYDRIFESS